jgi:hypothetical protein
MEAARGAPVPTPTLAPFSRRREAAITISSIVLHSGMAFAPLCAQVDHVLFGTQLIDPLDSAAVQVALKSSTRKVFVQEFLKDVVLSLSTEL